MKVYVIVEVETVCQGHGDYEKKQVLVYRKAFRNQAVAEAVKRSWQTVVELEME